MNCVLLTSFIIVALLFCFGVLSSIKPNTCQMGTQQILARHWIRSHDRAQYGSCQSEVSLAIASLDQNGTTHWHLPLWPQLAIVIGAQSGCHMVIYGYYYFFNFYTKMRRLDGSRVVPGVIPAPLLL